MDGHYCIFTMGCQMNEYDSDYLGRVLMESGFLPTENPRHADIILMNTCAVRQKAEQKAYSMLGRLLSIKRENPELILGLTGCIAQQEGLRLMKRFPELDLVMGTREIGSFQDILKKIEGGRRKIVATDLEVDPPHFRWHNACLEGRVKGAISIMEGCNNFCSYCVVPLVRGRESSRSPEEIIEEATGLVTRGVKEITLLGQNVNSYCWQDGEEVQFPLLLRRLNDLPGLLRIRFTTSHPKDLSENLIHCFGELDNLCPHIHLPFQSGSNRVLERMNRRYTRERYMTLVEALRQMAPDIAVTADVMVGFPGESDEDFQATLDLIKKIEFDNLFSFKYSDRKGTSAEKMEGKIDERVKTYRLATLQKLQRDITLKKNKILEGQAVEILVEGESKKGGQLAGRTSTNKIVNLLCNENIIGSLVNVKIKHASAHCLWGEIAA